MDIKDKILKIVPEVTFTEQGDTVAVVPLASFRKLAEALRHDPEDAMDFMRDIVGNNVTILSSPEEVPEPIVKVAVYSPEGAQAAAPLLVPRWGGLFRAAISGGEWVDFNSTDKGSGLRRLCAALDIPLADTAAFGDSFNDAPMLELAGRAYIKSTACPELLSRFENRCSDVAQTLAEII